MLSAVYLIVLLTFKFSAMKIQYPKKMTDIFHHYLGHRLRSYAYPSNAQLGTMKGIDGVVWVMELHEGKIIHQAIYEVKAKTLYIYGGEQRYTPVVDLHQVVDLGDVKGEVFSDDDGNVCLRIL